MKIGNVLSLFDGLSGCQLALKKAGIEYENYYASEIKKHAIKVTQHNFPNTIQLGDVRNVCGKDLPNIELLTFGSPCQDFSSANKVRAGLDGAKSSLFFEALRILKEVKPKYFLMENVRMDKKSYEIISRLLGTYPVNINSSRVSAQLRNRFYWTNIGPESFDLFGFRKCEIPQPTDKKIMLKDVIESGFVDRKKARALIVSDSRPHKDMSLAKRRFEKTGFTTIVYTDPNKNDVRHLTQTELERLQTVPEGYTSCVSRNQAANLLGDGWTIDVIAHIFSFINQ